MSAVARARGAFARIAEVDRPEVWVTLRALEDVVAEAQAVDAGPLLPLGGTLLAVKDNIDVAGLPTTAGCPAYAYEPGADAPAVARLRAAGAIVLGKTNLDQFATGLVGTRSPFGPVRDARRPDYVSGGSSSGSAVAVALGLADFGLGTDTAGSGRVPAAFQGVVGVKPTRGLVPVAGVVPACRTLDCVTVLARDIGGAERVLWLMAGPEEEGGGGAAAAGAAAALDRSWPPDAPLGAPPAPRIAIPASGALDRLSADARRAFAAAAERMAAVGATLVEFDATPFLAAGQLLYGGAYVAERHAAVGAFIEAQPEAVDPTVREIITAAGRHSASRLVRDGVALDGLRVACTPILAATDALLFPTASRQPTIAEVAADPLGVNAELGRFTSFVNLLDLCAVAVPAGEADGGRYGVSLVTGAFGDLVLADLARRFLDEPPGPPTPGEPAGIPVLVLGAHRRGQALHGELAALGARDLGVVRTAPAYRMHALATDPPKPGLVRVASGGMAIEGELWAMPVTGLGSFLAALPRPMALGHVALADGCEVVGFLCEPDAVVGAPDISEHGSWPAYLAAAAQGGERHVLSK
ncbi:MAG TPA: allophanate hydrolase [Solirubrobacteraceae bacterium]|nr:allophanate hydrolase [Solirubrobacteraceae bacterium]